MINPSLLLNDPQGPPVAQALYNHPGLVTPHCGRDTAALFSFNAAAENLQARHRCTELRLPLSNMTGLPYQNPAYPLAFLNNHPSLSLRRAFRDSMIVKYRDKGILHILLSPQE